jgi:hypothetical protein
MTDVSLFCPSLSATLIYCHKLLKVRVIVIDATFNNISVKPWLSVLLVEENRVPREKH